MLVNNAGLGGYAKVVEMTDEQWMRVLDVTLTGTFRMTRAVLPHMIARGSGAIVNNASVLGWRAQEGQAHYAAAKAGVMAFTRCVAMEAAPLGRARERRGAEPRDARVPGEGDAARARSRSSPRARPSAAPRSPSRWRT